MSQKTILIIEDNPINLRLAKTVVVKHGYNALTAMDAEHALTTLKNSHPDLILMDLQLPDMDGFQLTTLLKKNPATKDIIILAITAFAVKGTEKKALKAGCDGYVTKPIDVRTLPGILDKYLEGK